MLDGNEKFDLCREIVKQIKALRLDRGLMPYNVTAQEVYANYNGTGTEALGTTVRDLLDWIYSDVQASVAIHDFDWGHFSTILEGMYADCQISKYELGVRSRNEFEASNLRFLHNMNKQVYAKYPRFKTFFGLPIWKASMAPQRLLGLGLAQAAYIAVDGPIGWAEWQNNFTIEGL